MNRQFDTMYIDLARMKLVYAETKYSDYQLEQARWLISYDVASKITKYIVLHGDRYEKTLMGLPIDICDGSEVLKLYVEA